VVLSHRVSRRVVSCCCLFADIVVGCVPQSGFLVKTTQRCLASVFPFSDTRKHSCVFSFVDSPVVLAILAVNPGDAGIVSLILGEEGHWPHASGETTAPLDITTHSYDDWLEYVTGKSVLLRDHLSNHTVLYCAMAQLVRLWANTLLLRAPRSTPFEFRP
jgi:hypothetical protein